MKWKILLLLVGILLAVGCTQGGNGMIVENGDTVSVQYIGKFTDGTVFDQSTPGNDLNFKVGEHKVIAGFENGVLGMKEGETKTVTIPPEQAYGNEKSFAQISLQQLKDVNIVPTVGMQLQLGTGTIATIDSIDANGVTISYYEHPLGGKTLVFEITVEKIVRP
ncbi:MAG: FKBP-type peptidyl-prolyl cis-trans isomerase [Candidatus Diapherotrites archaeon]